MIIERASISELAGELSGKVFDRPVIDATGLKGRYDIRFDMAAVRAANQADPTDPAGAMMSALEYQMELKLVAQGAGGRPSGRSRGEEATENWGEEDWPEFSGDPRHFAGADSECSFSSGMLNGCVRLQRPS
jgi:hypothetical protein